MCFYAKANVSSCIYNKPHFASQRTFARIEFLRQGGRLVGKMAAIMLNFVLKTLHKRAERGVVAVRFFSFVVGLALFAVLWVGFSHCVRLNLPV